MDTPSPQNPLQPNVPAQPAAPITQNIGTPVPQVPPLAPAPAPLAAKTGFKSGKILTMLIAVGVIGGSGALGYFVFPEPFYNSVGKYIGLPAPAGVEGIEETGESESKTAEENAEAAEEPKDIFQSAVLEKLPGADANFLVSLRLSEKIRELLKNSLPPEDGDLDWFDGAQHMIMAVKLDFSNMGAMAASDKLEVPIAVAIQVAPNEEDAALEKIRKGQADMEDFFPVAFTTLGEGLLLGENSENRLEGKFSENPMYEVLRADSDLAIAFDFQDFLKNNPPQESDLKNPETIKELALAGKIKSTAILASLVEENEKLNIEASARFSMEDAAAAQEMLPYLDEQLNFLKRVIPGDYGLSILMETKLNENAAELKVTVKDVDTFFQKIKETVKKQRENAAKQEEELMKLFEEKENELEDADFTEEDETEENEVIELKNKEPAESIPPARPKIPRTPVK